MNNNTNQTLKMDSNYTSSFWSSDEALLVVHCEGSNLIHFFARQTSDIFVKYEKFEDQFFEDRSVTNLLMQILRNSLVGE